MEDLDNLEELAEHIKGNALCGLGQTAPNPVLSTMKQLPGRVCRPRGRKALPGRRPARHCCSYTIDPDKCKGCSACARVCPADAISGT